MLRGAGIALTMLVSLAAFAQTPTAPTAFEVATIKLTDPNFGGMLIQFPAGTLSLRGFTLPNIIGFAYSVDIRQVIGVPKQLESERYDVVGKSETPLGTASTDVKPMVQALLADRFQLKFHRETREIPVYVLTVRKGGHKMKPRTEGDGGPATSLLVRGANVPARNATVAMFVSALQSLVLDRPIIDKTGITGKFDFDLAGGLTLVNSADVGGTLPAASDPDRADLFTAIQEQLGLKLDAEKGPGEVIVVDAVEKPSPN